MDAAADTSGRTALRAVAALAIILVVLAADQGSKRVAGQRLAGRPPVPLMGGILVLRYVENQGAFLSAGARLPAAFRRVLLLAVPMVMVCGMAWVTARRIRRGFPGLVGPSLIIGGGLGNLADRLLHAGRVGDFLYLDLGIFHSGIFNVADLAIMAGCAVLLLQTAFGARMPGTPAR